MSTNERSLGSPKTTQKRSSEGSSTGVADPTAEFDAPSPMQKNKLTAYFARRESASPRSKPTAEAPSFEEYQSLKLSSIQTHHYRPDKQYVMTSGPVAASSRPATMLSTSTRNSREREDILMQMMKSIKYARSRNRYEERSGCIRPAKQTIQNGEGCYEEPLENVPLLGFHWQAETNVYIPDKVGILPAAVWNKMHREGRIDPSGAFQAKITPTKCDTGIFPAPKGNPLTGCLWNFVQGVWMTVAHAANYPANDFCIDHLHNEAIAMQPRKMSKTRKNGQYSFRAKAEHDGRLLSDGCIEPENGTFRDASGFFLRPYGPNPKGYCWDARVGLWMESMPDESLDSENQNQQDTSMRSSTLARAATDSQNVIYNRSTEPQVNVAIAATRGGTKEHQASFAQTDPHLSINIKNNNGYKHSAASCASLNRNRYSNNRHSYPSVTSIINHGRTKPVHRISRGMPVPSVNGTMIHGRMATASDIAIPGGKRQKVSVASASAVLDGHDIHSNSLPIEWEELRERVLRCLLHRKTFYEALCTYIDEGEVEQMMRRGRKAYNILIRREQNICEDYEFLKNGLLLSFDSDESTLIDSIINVLAMFSDD
ncbi:hypothetical protein MPSEU_000931700 [Mayamaea pseudoterrestris]|nr:hypothetical protein MPSEU_000931700 [Mayamaea pseudoterrestris]